MTCPYVYFRLLLCSICQYSLYLQGALHQLTLPLYVYVVVAVVSFTNICNYMEIVRTGVNLITKESENIFRPLYLYFS
jgi:hypothetical protein